MAIGKKTLPNGTFEKGDLLASKISGGIYYLSNSLTSETEEIDTSEDTFGQITELDVPASGGEAGKWMAVRLAYSPKVVYVPQDSTLYSSKVNPEYNYGNAPESKKSGGFSWENLLGTISGLASAALGIFSNAKKTATPIGEQQAENDKAQEKPTAWDWIKSNILLIVIMPTFLVLIILLIRVFTKPKAPVQNTAKPPKLFK